MFDVYKRERERERESERALAGQGALAGLWEAAESGIGAPRRAPFSRALRQADCTHLLQD